MAWLKSFVAGLLRSAKAVDRDSDVYAARAWAILTHPWGVAVGGAVMVGVLTLALRIMVPRVPTGAIVHIVAPCVCRALAGAVFLVVLFKLIELRDQGAGRWCVGVLALLLVPLLFMDAIALSFGQTWAELIARERAFPDPFIIVFPVVLVVVSVSAVFLFPFLLQRADRQTKKALESRK